MKWLWIWIALGILTVAFIVTILWQVGLFQRHPKRPMIVSTEHIEDTQKLPLIESEKLQPAYCDPVVVSEEVDADQIIAKWLKPPPFMVPHIDNDWPFQQTVGDWPFVSELLPTDSLLDGAQFGYSLDAHQNTAVVGAPGMNRVYVYDHLQLVQTLVSESKQFGMNVAICKPDCKLLAAQSNDGVHVYEWEDQRFVLKSVLSVAIQFSILSFSSDRSLWIVDQNRGETHIHESPDWSLTFVIPKMIMAISNQCENRVWAASVEGLSHWSKNTHKEWTEDANWLMKVPLTTVAEIGDDRLIVGESHMDRFSIVSKQNPETILDSIMVPGGPIPNTTGLFSDCVVESNGFVIVSHPLDINGRGAVTAYQIESGMPLGMMIGMYPDAQFASHVRKAGDKVLVSCPSMRGLVYILSLVNK